MTRSDRRRLILTAFSVTWITLLSIAVVALLSLSGCQDDAETLCAQACGATGYAYDPGNVGCAHRPASCVCTPRGGQ
jgi:hypothetical protein